MQQETRQDEAGEVRQLDAVVTASRLSRTGDYVTARALLESADLLTDDKAAMFTIMILDKMDEQAAKQKIVEQLVDALEPDTQRSDMLLTFLMRQAERACLSSEQIGKVHFAAKQRDRTTGDLGTVYRAVRRRQKFRLSEAPRAAGVRFISLGLNCLPWTMLNRWGLRDKTQFIEEFNPFSLATHKIPSLINALKTDFATYMSPDVIEVDDSDRSHLMVRHKDGTVLWNHNQGPYWTTGTFEPLLSKLAGKIDNFRRTCVGDDVVFMISGLGGGQHKDLAYVPELQKALSRHTGRLNNRILLTSQKAKAPKQAVRHLDDHVTVFFCPIPSRGYVWFVLDTADSAEGLQFERSYMDLLYECLENWGLLSAAT